MQYGLVQNAFNQVIGEPPGDGKIFSFIDEHTTKTYKSRAKHRETIGALALCQLLTS